MCAYVAKGLQFTSNTCDLHLTMFNTLKYRHINAACTVFYRRYINVAINTHMKQTFLSLSKHVQIRELYAHI